MGLLGASDELVAVHAGQEKVSDEQVECSLFVLFEDLEGLLGVACVDDAVAAGLEQEGAEGEGLFVAVDAEDDFFRTHGGRFSLSSRTPFGRSTGWWAAV